MTDNGRNSEGVVVLGNWTEESSATRKVDYFSSNALSLEGHDRFSSV
jgi:hypothetical protein